MVLIIGLILGLFVSHLMGMEATMRPEATPGSAMATAA